MPKKINLEDPIIAKRKNVKIKLAFLVLTGVLLLLTNVLMSSYEPDKKARQSTQGVLGESATLESEELKKNFNKTLDELKAQITVLSAQLEERSTSLISTGTNEIKKQTGDYLNDNTLKPMVEKINDLPEDQKKIIQEAVCK